MTSAMDPRVGDRVMVLPHTDSFMQGFRYGTVEKVGRKYLHVRVESMRYGTRLRRFLPEHVAVDLILPNWLTR